MTAQRQPDEEAGLPRPAASATHRLWAALARARHARALHPRGRAYAATLEVPGGADTGVALFDRAATHDGVVRLSRALGLPSPLPDARGLALRVPDLHGPGRHQDILLTTSVDLPVLHHLPLPAASEQSQTYSSLLPYRVAGRRCLLGAQPEGDGRFALAICTPGGRFHKLATLRLGAPLPAERSAALKFDPWNTGGGLEPAPGAIQRLRRPAYRGSQDGRAAG